MKGSIFVVMDKDTTQATLYEHDLSFFLPEGMLDFFELVWMETESLTSSESQKDIAYTGVLHIHLDERDSRTEAQQDQNVVKRSIEQMVRTSPI